MRTQAFVLVMVAVTTQAAIGELDGVIAVVPPDQRFQTGFSHPLGFLGVAVRLVNHAVQRRLHELDDSGCQTLAKGAPGRFFEPFDQLIERIGKTPSRHRAGAAA